MMSVRSKIALFPCVGCLGDRTGGNHVQQVLALTLDSRGGLMGRQAGVHIGHSHTCQETNTSVVSVLEIVNIYSMMKYYTCSILIHVGRRKDEGRIWL